MSALDHDVDVAATRDLPAPGSYLCGLTWDGRHLWHSDQLAGALYAVDPAHGDVVRQWPCASVRADLTWDGQELLQVGGRPKRLMAIDPGTGQVTGQRSVPPPSGRLTGVEATSDGIWMCLRDPMVVQLRDYPAMVVRREFAVPGTSPAGLTYADGTVIYGDFDAARLYAIDTDTGALRGSIRVPGRPTGLTFDGQYLWYCDFPARRFRALSWPAVRSQLR